MNHDSEFIMGIIMYCKNSNRTHTKKQHPSSQNRAQKNLGSKVHKLKFTNFRTFKYA